LISAKSGRGCGDSTLTVAAVASFTTPMPSCTMPAPKVSAAVSELPQTTGVPSARPVARAAAAPTWPTTALDATIGGSVAMRQPIRSHSVCDQRTEAASSIKVPSASRLSASQVPVNLARSQSLARYSRATRAKASGSASRSHSICGSVQVGLARLAAMAKICASACARNAWVCARLRWSFHKMAGRMTRPWASSSTWVWAPAENEIAAMARAGQAACASTARNAWQQARHQSCGSCSLQPGCGDSVATGLDASATSAPSARTMLTFSEPAPRSMPASSASVAAMACAPPGETLANILGPGAGPQAELAGVEQIARIERVLDRLQHVQPGAEFAPHPRPAKQPGAVVVLKRSAMRQRQILHHLPQLGVQRQRGLRVHRRQAHGHVLAGALRIDMRPV